MPENTRILVTGATGFLGGHILGALAGRDDVELIAACRTPERLPDSFRGEVRVGDLADADYRRDVVRGADVVIHAGTWSSFWGHREEERALYLEPSLDLIEQSIGAGVTRFISAASVAMSEVPRTGAPVDDDAPPAAPGFWPHLEYMVQIENHQRARAAAGTQMVSMRLGHFIGAGNDLGLVAAIIPRLATRMVPWVAGGRSRLALVTGTDMGRAFARAALAPGLSNFESFNITGPKFPTAREVFTLIAAKAGVPRPFYSVPTFAAYGFGALMEWLHPILPGRAPFLTRSLVHVGEDWFAPSTKAAELLGYLPEDDWKAAVLASIEERRRLGFPWPALGQATTPARPAVPVVSRRPARVG